jgi:hypothetical protein
MISQRKSAAPGLGARASLARESGTAEGPEKFMSAILTYLGFNVTKLPATTKY